MTKNNLKTLSYAVIVIGLIGGLFLWGSYQSVIVPTVTDPSKLSGINIGEVSTWVPEIPHLSQRLHEIGLRELGTEGTALHIHQHLDIFVNGEHVEVPTSIGINNILNYFSPIHTHDNSGIIHVESDRIQTFTLGQIFDVWGVRFTADCIGGYCKDANNPLKVFVNGKEYTEDSTALKLEAHQEIAVVYGTDKGVTVPASYEFPKGE